MSKRVIITSALPYVNNIPHLGNIIGCVLPADVSARYHRSQNRKVLYVCGTDEYGTATEVKAREEGITPRELCDKYYAKHKEIYDWLNISFDVFGRTSTPNPRTDITHYHTLVSQDIFSRLSENGYLEEREVEQLYCAKIERFVSDRFVVGICPKCGDANARGDQCDKCQSVYESIELIQPHLRGDNDAILENRKSKHLFLRLDLLQPRIQDWFNKVKHLWSANAVSVTEAWLKKGLEPRCITRDMEWGTPLPDDIKLEGKEHKVMYNWFDAPIGYISIGSVVTEAGDDWTDAWEDPKVRLIQFMGVDNVPFHSILFPGSLLGTGEPYTLVSEIASVHYLNYEGGKFSKTDNHGVFGDQMIASGISCDYWRYYLLKIRAEDQLGPNGTQHGNSNFVWSDFVSCCNTDLSDNIGNLIHRVFTLAHSYFKGTVKQSVNWIEIACVKELCERSYEDNRFAAVIRHILHLASLTNKYLTDIAPWKLYKENRTDPKIENTVAVALLAVKEIATQLVPIIPETASLILGFIVDDGYTIKVKEGFTPFFAKPST